MANQSLLFIAFLVGSCHGANILVFHHVASYSHRVATWPLAEALSSRGHKVTYISPYYPKHPNPNITELVPAKMASYVDTFLNEEFDINLRVTNSMERIVDKVFQFGYGACESLHSSPEFLQWMSSGEKIDLMIIDNCMAECGVGLAFKLNSKYIIFSTVATLGHEYDLYGLVPESYTVPELEVNPPVPPMGFLTRVSNAVKSLEWAFRYYFYAREMDTLLRDKLNVPSMPHIGDLVSQASLVFYTGDPITDYPRAMPPNFVNIAGIHCRESKKSLPEQIEDFIRPNMTDSGLTDDHGFVYISLGSLVVSSNLPDSIKQVFFDAIASFPQLKFLWKWNGEFPTTAPENLYFGKWFPQIDVLSHPKIRAFITQSGRPSALESLYLGVPMITFPILGDQDFNANRLHESGAAVAKLEIGSVTVEELRAAIRKAVYDPSSKAKMTKLQEKFRDRPMTPVETGVWWTEYVLRSADTRHLLPVGHNHSWFVRRQIDVWAFLSIASFVVLTASVVACTKLARGEYDAYFKAKKE